jgi:hypothetical protein
MDAKMNEEIKFGLLYNSLKTQKMYIYGFSPIEQTIICLYNYISCLCIVYFWLIQHENGNYCSTITRFLRYKPQLGVQTNGKSDWS